MKTLRVRVAVAALAASALVFGPAAWARADFGPVELPAGVACADFGLRVEGLGDRVQREFTDREGNVVRLLTAGRGYALTFTNLSTGAQLELQPNGSVEHVAVHPDGVNTWTVTGHNVLIFFPTDQPPGPSTTLYVGRVVFDADAAFNFTLRSTAGTATDICAALSS
jgi:hypothetical protein